MKKGEEGREMLLGTLLAIPVIGVILILSKPNKGGLISLAVSIIALIQTSFIVWLFQWETSLFQLQGIKGLV
jgi:hypothetical protein